MSDELETYTEHEYRESIIASEALGRRIRKAIEQSGRAQAEVARLLNVTPQSVAGWITTGRISKGKLRELADLLRVSLPWLISGVGPVEAMTNSTVYRLPLSDWGSPGEASQGYATIVSTKPLGPNSYTLPVEGDAMTGEFAPGTNVVIDPDLPPTPGRFVVASVNDGPPMLRRLDRDGAAWCLKASNPAYPAIVCAESELRVLGVVVQSFREL